MVRVCVPVPTVKLVEVVVAVAHANGIDRRITLPRRWRTEADGVRILNADRCGSKSSRHRSSGTSSYPSHNLAKEFVHPHCR